MKPPSTFTMQTNRVKGFEPCEDKVNGCTEDSSGDDSLLWIIIGVAAFCFLFLLVIVWYCIHKCIDRQFMLQDEVTPITNEVVHKIQADMAYSGDIKSSKTMGSSLRLPTPTCDTSCMNAPTAPAVASSWRSPRSARATLRVTVQATTNVWRNKCLMIIVYCIEMERQYLLRRCSADSSRRNARQVHPVLVRGGGVVLQRRGGAGCDGIAGLRQRRGGHLHGQLGAQRARD
jgi:hypothetical protein